MGKSENKYMRNNLPKPKKEIERHDRGASFCVALDACLAYFPPRFPMSEIRPVTPPPRDDREWADGLQLTPEQVKQVEINRLKGVSEMPIG